MSTNDDRKPTSTPDDEHYLKHSYVPPTTKYPPMPVPEIGEDKDKDQDE